MYKYKYITAVLSSISDLKMVCKNHDKKASNILKSVYISESNDVYKNLALEDWFYQKLDFTKHHILLLWRNSQCVVIGRHQNPWVESDLSFMNDRRINMARRNSGGGTVYHDHGNLNATFFTSRDYYSRLQNLLTIVRALKKEWGIETYVNNREDIMFDKYKISGTASKLGRKNTYHHCTLLVDTNKSIMSRALHKADRGIATNATASVPSKVMNLKEIENSITVDHLITVIGLEYLRTCPFTNENKGVRLISNQNGFHYINPSEEQFPGITQNIQEFSSWKWNFGRTPKFNVKQYCSFPLLSNPLDIYINIEVERGKITNLTFDFPATVSNFITDDKNIAQSFINVEYSEQVFDKIKECLTTLLVTIFGVNCTNR